MLFRFKKGLYPMPLLAINNTMDETFFNSLEYKNGKFTEKNNHLFTLNAYVIVDFRTNKIIAYAFFKEIMYLIWLVIFINKEIEIEFDNKTYLFYKEPIDNFFYKL